MGSELARRGAGSATGLWSAKALLDAPDMVVQVHRDYIAAGAKVITTNSYSTVPSYLEKEGLADRYEELTHLAGELARRAVKESGEDVRVAGSLPPLSESYRPDLIPDAAESLPVYAGMVGAMRDNVDLFLCETMSSGAEAAHAVSQASAHGLGKPVMVSWTLNEEPGNGLRSGDSVADAFAKLQDFELAAYLFNCTHAEAILAALRELKAITDKPIGGYPNRLNTVDPQWTLDNNIQIGMRDDINVEYYLTMAERFAESGASIIGGCCGIGPDYIAALSERLVTTV
jgi:S-methylmethionine-dependent homocysteine/selenocysteine methylase|tara:strand:- start:1075 stop:1935 length:861 start_codon:yes stop_codon:yes gene_type:complete